MVQEQFALTICTKTKALGWKASFQSGLGAQHHPQTDRAFQTHIQTSWSGSSGTPMCIKPSVLHVAFSISSSPLYLPNKHQLEIPQETLTSEAKNGVFSYSVRAIQNWEEKLLTFTSNGFESPTFSSSSSTFEHQCHCEMTKVLWRGQSPFPPPFP